jgi:hypothetical protein
VPAGAKMIVVFKANVEHGVLLALSHAIEFAFIEVSQTYVFHQFLLVSCDSESRSSSFCYQMVVREAESRQLLHFFAEKRASCRRSESATKSRIPSFCKGNG